MALSKNESKRKKQLANLEKGKFKKGEVTNPKGRPPKPRTMTTFIAEMKEKGYEVPTALAPLACDSAEPDIRDTANAPDA